MSRMRVTCPCLSDFKMMSPNCSGVVSRPSASTLIWYAALVLNGGALRTPAETWTFCARSAAKDFTRAYIDGCCLVRINPDSHRIFAISEELEVRHARQACNLIANLQHVVGHIFGASRPVGRIFVYAQ